MSPQEEVAGLSLNPKQKEIILGLTQTNKLRNYAKSKQDRTDSMTSFLSLIMNELAETIQHIQTRISHLSA